MCRKLHQRTGLSCRTEGPFHVGDHVYLGVTVVQLSCRLVCSSATTEQWVTAVTWLECCWSAVRGDGGGDG